MGVSIRTKKIEDEIVRRMSAGETLVSICKGEGMPSTRAVYDWVQVDPEGFGAEFGRARDLGFDAIAADTLAIADTDPERYATETGSKVDPGYVQWQKNRVEQRMKLLAKWDPRRYGDKVSHELTGKDGGAIEIDDKRSLAKAILARATAAPAKPEGSAS